MLLQMITPFRWAPFTLWLLGAAFLPAGLAVAAELSISPAPAGASVYFITPANRAVLSSPVVVRFGLTNMGVAPAGMERMATGHHHLLVDMKELPDMSRPLPATEQLRHFGGGQTEVSLELGPGVHTLQLLLGNHLHIPHDQPVLSESISITVK
jgi:hypothetical protein